MNLHLEPSPRCNSGGSPQEENASALQRDTDPSQWKEWLNLIGSALKVIRVIRGLRQEDVASSLAKTQDYVCRVENGHTHVSFKRLGEFCAVLGCRPSQVMAVAEDLAKKSSRSGSDVVADLKRLTRDVIGQTGYTSEGFESR